MTYVIGGEDVNDFDELIHYGKKGMKWGVRNDKPTGGSGRSSAPAKPRPKLTPEQRMQIGKQVTLAVVATAGGIGVSALAGPVAGAAAGAALRGVGSAFTVKTTVTDSSFGPTNGIKINGRSNDGMYDITDQKGRDMKVDAKILESMLDQQDL